MPVLCVPNWSFGRERTVVREVKDLMAALPVRFHYCESDIDHNRTVTAFSGTPDKVESALFALADKILPTIDLNRHVGVHPRIGALDVCPFIPLPEASGDDRFKEYIEKIAERFSQTYSVPVLLYEKSEKGTHANQLPALRKAGFGGLLEHGIDSDHGPKQPHPLLGATVMGWREFLVAMNINFDGDAEGTVTRIASNIRQKRREGDPRYIGVRALGFHLVAQEMVQVSINLTDPAASGIDPIIEYVKDEAERAGLEPAYAQLIGVVRDTDIEHSVLLPYLPEQLVPTRESEDWRMDW